MIVYTNMYNGCINGTAESWEYKPNQDLSSNYAEDIVLLFLADDITCPKPHADQPLVTLVRTWAAIILLRMGRI